MGPKYASVHVFLGKEACRSPVNFSQISTKFDKKFRFSVEYFTISLS